MYQRKPGFIVKLKTESALGIDQSQKRRTPAHHRRGQRHRFPLAQRREPERHDQRLDTPIRSRRRPRPLGQPWRRQRPLHRRPFAYPLSLRQRRRGQRHDHHRRRQRQPHRRHRLRPTLRRRRQRLLLRRRPNPRHPRRRQRRRHDLRLTNADYDRRLPIDRASARHGLKFVVAHEVSGRGRTVLYHKAVKRRRRRTTALRTRPCHPLFAVACRRLNDASAASVVGPCRGANLVFAARPASWSLCFAATSRSPTRKSTFV